MFVVTGGAGFLGSNFVERLERTGRGQIVVSDRLRDGVKWKNLAKRNLMDIVHPDDLFDFLEDNARFVECVIHMGAISSTTETDADLIFENNFRLSMDLWNWCAIHQTRYVYASSAATYGDGSLGFDDDATPAALAKLRPMNAYGWSKHLFDRRVIRMLEHGEAAPPQWVGLKFFNVYGPNEFHKGPQSSVVNQLTPKIAAGEIARLFQSHHPDYEDGGQLRDFVWAGDCVDLVDWFLDNPDKSGLYNCGTGEARSFKDLALAVFAALGREPEIEYIPTPEAIRDKYQYYTQANMDRVRALGYDKPFTSLEDGVAKYVKDYLTAEDPFL